MDLRLVEIFCHVHRARSFSRAAKELGLTQPTVSAHVKDLEQALGTRLFNRLGRDIEPTDAGRFLYQRAQPVLSLGRELDEQMAGFLNRVEGVLTIGASSVPGEFLLPRIASEFHARHPGLQVRVGISDTARTIADVRQGVVELGVVGSAVSDDALAFEPFASDELVLAIPPGAAWPWRRVMSLREVRELPLLLREEGSATRQDLERALVPCKLKLQDFKIAAELGSTGAIKEAVKAGYGVSFLSELTIAGDLKTGALRVARVRELGRVRRTYYIAMNKRRLGSPSTRAFLEYIRQTRKQDAPGRPRAKR